MKYNFQVMVALTYEDKDIDVEIELSDEEVTRIKELVAASAATDEEPEDGENFVPEKSLLSILEENDSELFDKFWGAIMPPVFVELLTDAMANHSNDMRHDDDEFDDYHEADFDELYDMYGDEIELEHSSCYICRIPDAFVGKA